MAPVFGANRTVEAGAIVISDLGDPEGGVNNLRSARKPALGTFNLRSASAMSQAVYFPSFWSRSFVGLDVAIRRSFVRTSRLYFWKFWVERGT